MIGLEINALPLDGHFAINYGRAQSIVPSLSGYPDRAQSEDVEYFISKTLQHRVSLALEG